MNLKALLKRYTVDQLKEAIRLRSQVGRVEALEEKKATLLKQVAKIDRKLSKLNGHGAVSTGRKPGRRKGFKLSAETRRKMSEAAKRRYAGRAAPPASERKRRTISPEGRAKMAEAARRRRAKVKGETAQAPAQA
jgi:hypothetical protein